MKNKRPSKGEIWLVDFNPIKGKEQSGVRPAVIVSGNAMNQYFSIIMVCPLSTKIKNFLGNIVLEPTYENGLSDTSEIITFQMRSISKVGLIKRLGVIAEKEIETVVNSVIDRMTY